MRKDKDFHDFRTMPRMIKMMKSSMKRLQVGPKNAKKKVEQKSMAWKTLRKLITKLTNEIPEMKIGEEVRRKQRLDVKMRKKEETSPSLEEDCLTLLSGMSLYQGKKPGDVTRLDSRGRDSQDTLFELGSLRLMEDRMKAAMQVARLEEALEPGSPRRDIDEQWQDFSDSFSL